MCVSPWVEEEGGGGGLASRKVFQLRQCLYKYVNCRSFELESGDSKFNRTTLRFSVNNFIKCSNFQIWTKNSRHVCAGTAL